ncbi:MAG: glutamate racemase [Deltaproteobacteria bacterium]|nr:glutamate racemase [Deltaproteobacteria bacterium]
MKKPIGIFDSGIGGLTVLKEIMRVLPQEDTIYLGDTARVPYGAKSPDTVVRYSLENARFLLKFDIKALVVACNTASAYALSRLSAEIPVPVIGVIMPGAKKAVSVTKNKKIGVIGTDGTIKSRIYLNTIKTIAPDASVFSKACPLFVPLAEEGWIDNDVAFLTADKYLSELKDQGIDTLVLGCTHYPILKDIISRVIGSSVTLIDSGQETALEAAKVLQDKNILNANPQAQPFRKFFVTDSPERFIQVGELFLGTSFNNNVDKVDVMQYTLLNLAS